MKRRRNPFAFFYNLRISVKILIGYIAALALASVLGVLAIIQLDRVNATVTQLTGHLSQERDLAEQMTVQIYRIRLYANQYIAQGQDSAVLESYNQALGHAQTLLDEGEETITENTRIGMLSRMGENFDQFATAFAEIVQILSASQELETNTLIPQYTASMDQLALLRNNSFEALDFTSAHYASQVRDTFSQMQGNVSQYLATSDDQYADQADQDYEVIRSTFNLLNSSVRDQAGRALVSEIDTAVTAYQAGFQTIRSLAAQQHEQVSTQLDVYGLAVEQTATEIADSINREFNTQSQRTNQIVTSTRLGVLVTIGLVDVVGLVFGMLLSRIITRPIQQVARAAQGIAGGALDQEVHVQSNDELGILAEAFNHMTAQVRETMDELQQSLTSLRDSQERQRLILETSPTPFLITHFDGTFQYTNQRFIDLLGQDVNAMPQNVIDLYADPAERQTVLDTLRQQGHLDNYEMRARTADSSLVWILMSARVLKFKEESVVLSSLIDITSLKQTEDRLRQSEAELRQAQRVAKIGSWRWDIAGDRLYWSDEMYHIFGIEKEKFSGSLDEVVAQAIHPDDRAAVEQSNLSVVQEKKPIPLEYRVIRPDGSVRVVWAEAGELTLNEQGQPSALTGIVQDITERKQVEEEVRRLNTELEQRVIERTEQLASANRELESFSYSVSHDLRAPLRAIDGFSRILQEDFEADLPPGAAHLIQSLRENARHMGHLIDDLLRFSRLSRQALSKLPVDMATLVHQALQTLEPEREGRQVAIAIGELPACQGDPGLLLQVWINLLSNALKFTRRREVAHIEIGCQAGEQGETVYFVRDNGVGFNMRYSGKLFGVFQRLHPADEFEGTGVGLALVQRIIQRHGGRIWAEAQPDAGATFFFILGEGLRIVEAVNGSRYSQSV
jgi:PAS domain S-box-containing protein